MPQSIDVRMFKRGVLGYLFLIRVTENKDIEGSLLGEGCLGVSALWRHSGKETSQETHSQKMI